MSNPFLTDGHEEIETAILLEKAIQCDLQVINPRYENAVAFTDGTKVFINSDDRLAEILPAYDKGMLKWLLWHEEYHKQLSHHNRFFKYLKELDEKETKETFQLTKEEVNIIMDILVHDSLSRMFPELVNTAIANLAQMRNRNSLGYTFKTFNLEDMLDEYKAQKKDDKIGESKDEKDSESEKGGDKSADKSSKDKSKKKDDDKSKDESDKKGHSKGGTSDDHKKDKPEDKDPEVTDGSEPEHDKTDWSKLKDIDTKEFIDAEESEHLQERIQRLKRKKFKLARLTQKLNSLATTTRERTYSIPSYIQAGKGTILKGRKPGKTALYLCFDASGSMSSELETFKTIISKSIPQAMDTPTEWFSGFGEQIPGNPEKYDYYKGKFKDIIPVQASSGYEDDGDRTIELCWKAEQAGYSPIGVTDGGGQISWSKKYLKELKRTVLVGQNESWLKKAKEINPRIQTIDI